MLATPLRNVVQAYGGDRKDGRKSQLVFHERIAGSRPATRWRSATSANARSISDLCRDSFSLLSNWKEDWTRGH